MAHLDGRGSTSAPVPAPRERTYTNGGTAKLPCPGHDTDSEGYAIPAVVLGSKRAQGSKAGAGAAAADNTEPATSYIKAVPLQQLGAGARDPRQSEKLSTCVYSAAVPPSVLSRRKEQEAGNGRGGGSSGGNGGAGSRVSMTLAKASSGVVAHALHDYSSSEPTVLELKQGDVVEVMEQADNG